MELRGSILKENKQCCSGIQLPHLLIMINLIDMISTFRDCEIDCFFVITTCKVIQGSYFFLCRCDADPAALAKYIVALIKKDKPESSLRDTCTDQLDVFLQDSK